MARKLVVEIIGDASSFNKALDSSTSRTRSFGSSLGRMAKVGALAAGAAGIGGLFVTLRAGISEYTEASKVGAQTNAVIKSTGGVANVSARQVDALAESILKKSGIDDEAIKSGQNLLLTFKNIRNEAGAGNDIFNQTTQVLADMSTAMGQSTRTSAIQLGKALNDPIKGLGSLARVGVQFTEGQKTMIKGMVEAGNTIGAQKVILQELNSQFGGSAEAAGRTLPGQLNILKETFNNLAGDLVGKAIPAVTTFVTFLNEKGIPILGEAFGKIGSVVGPAIQGLTDAFTAAGPAILGLLEPLGNVFRENIVPILLQFQDIGVRAISAVSEIIKKNGPELRQIFENLGEVISNMAKIVIPLLEFAFTKILPVAIKILIPVLVVLTEALAKISTVVRLIATAIQAVLLPAFSLIISVGTTVVNFITKTLVKAFEFATDPIRAIAGVLTGVLGGAFRGVTAAAGGVREVFEWFGNKAAGIWSKLAKVIPPAVALITAPFQALSNIIWSIIGAFLRFIDKAGEVIDLASKVAGAIGGIGGFVAGALPGRQHGGPVMRGSAYVVGEAGPELFIPNQSGRIMANGSGSMAAVGGMSVQLVFNGPTVGTSRDFEDAVRRALYDVSRRNPGTGL